MSDSSPKIILKKTKLGKKKFLPKNPDKENKDKNIKEYKENNNIISQEILIVGSNINKFEKETKASFLLKLIMKSFYLNIWKNKIKSLKYFSRKVNKQRINFKKFIKEISSAIEQHKYEYYNYIVNKINKLPLPDNIKHDKLFGTIKIIDKNKLYNLNNNNILETNDSKENFFEYEDFNKGIENNDNNINNYQLGGKMEDNNNYNINELLYEETNKEMDFNNNDFIETEYNYDEKEENKINKEENYIQGYYQGNPYYYDNNIYENEHNYNNYNEEKYINQEQEEIDYNNNIYEEDPYFQNESYYPEQEQYEEQDDNNEIYYEYEPSLNKYNYINNTGNYTIMSDIHTKPKIGNNSVPYYNNNEEEYLYGYPYDYNYQINNINNKRAFPFSSHNHVFYVSK